MTRYQSGPSQSVEALEATVRDHLPWIARQVSQRLGPVARSDGDTHDLIQDAFLEVLQRGPSFATTDQARFRRVLVKIVENNIRDRYRRLHRLKRDLRRNVGRATDTVLELDAPAESVTSPSVAASDNEQREWVLLAVELLSPADRDVLRLRDWEELEFAEIGERLGTTAEAARKRYHRALPKLSEKVFALRSGREGP